jgi:TatD DNase family protein
MTSTHASKAHLTSLPTPLSALFFPPSCRPEKFVEGQTVKGRNEPCAIGGVAWVIATLRGETIEVVSEAAWKNTVELFGLHDLIPEPPKPEFDIKNEQWPAL